MDNQDKINEIITELQTIEKNFKKKSNKEIEAIYFIISGYIISYIDGQVDQEELAAIEEFISDLNIGGVSKDYVNKIINKVKNLIDNNKDTTDIFDTCYELLSITTIDFLEYLKSKDYSIQEINSFKENYLLNLYKIAYADGLFHINEKEGINRISHYNLGFDEQTKGRIRNIARISSAFLERFDYHRKKYLHLRYKNISKPRVYLAGPFKNYEKESLNNQFSELKENYSDDLHFFTPFEREKFYIDMSKEQAYQAIAKDQKQDILNSDALIAYMPRPSIGTAMAIKTAFLSSRIVVVIVNNVNDLPSDMLPANSTKICDNFKDAIEECKKYVNKIDEVNLKVLDDNGIIQNYDFGQMKQYLTDVIYKSGIKDFFDISITVLARTILRLIIEKIEKTKLNTKMIEFNVIEDIVENFLISIADTPALSNIAKSFINYRMKTKENKLLNKNIGDITSQTISFVHDLKAPIGSAGRAIKRILDILENYNMSEEDMLNLNENKEFTLDSINDIKKRIKGFNTKIKVNFIKTRINIRNKIENIFERFKNENKNVNIKFIPNNLGELKDKTVFLHIVESKFERIIENLIKNAFDHGFKNLQQGNIYVDIKSKEIQNAISIDFWNDGHELSKDKCNIIFISNNKHVDSGVGLSGVKLMVEELGGQIECEYQEGAGPKFKIVFYDSHDIIETKILVADDNAKFRKEMKNILKKRGFEIHESETVQDTLNLLEIENYAAIICDIDFNEKKGRTGIDIIRYIQDNEINTKIIVISGSSNLPNLEVKVEKYKPDAIFYKDDLDLDKKIGKIIKW